MANLKRMIQQNIIAPTKSNDLKTSMGVVIDIHHNKNVAKVEMYNPAGRGKIILETVHIGLVGDGVHLRNIKKGDYVIVDFVGGSIAAPRITGLLYSDYDHVVDSMDHLDQVSTFKTQEVEIKNTMTQSALLFKDNQQPINNYFHKSFNLYDDILEVRRGLGRYQTQELGITHPISKSTVKFSNKGDIIISTSSNSGMVFTAEGDLIINAKNINIISSSNINVSTPKDIALSCNQVDRK